MGQITSPTSDFTVGCGHLENMHFLICNYTKGFAKTIIWGLEED